MSVYSYNNAFKCFALARMYRQEGNHVEAVYHQNLAAAHRRSYARSLGIVVQFPAI